jgi:hypothetical protein
MNSKKIVAGALVATVIPVGAAVLMTGAANAAPGSHPTPGSAASVTATASTSKPVSGKTFRVSGEFTENNKPAADQVVKIQALHDGSYQQLTGAKIRTDSQGDYSLRVVLDTTGHRELRVVGVGVGSQPNAYQPFSVQVHR